MTNSQEARAARAWRVATRSVSGGFAWDVARLRFLGDDGEESGTWASSGDAEAAFGVANVARKDSSIWGGRPDAKGRFHITLSETTRLGVSQIVMEQGHKHWARSIEIEALDDSGAWQLVRRFDHLRPGMNTLFLFAEPPSPARSRTIEPRLLDPFADRRVLVLIASYRDPELPHTISNALAQAAYPEHVRFAICHQHDEKTADLLAPWIDDPRFSIDAVPHTESRGCCWARARTFELFDNEPYMLQIDAHTRFAARWDVRYIDMLESTGSPLPVLTSYPPRYTIDDDGHVSYDTDAGVQSLVIEELRDDLTTLQKTGMAPDASRPGTSPTIGAGQIFTRGRFCRDVPYDPYMYFAGEEISLAARAFTSGYDLFYPSENLIWHLYQHDHPKHWEDHDDHGHSHQAAVERLRILFRGDAAALGPHGLGSARSLAAFESSAGIRLRDETTDAETGLALEIDRSVIEPRDDYEAFVIVFLDSDGHEVARSAIRSPDVLNLSRSSVTLYDIDTSRAMNYLVVPTRRNGTIGEVALRRM